MFATDPSRDLRCVSHHSTRVFCMLLTALAGMYEEDKIVFLTPGIEL